MRLKINNDDDARNHLYGLSYFDISIRREDVYKALKPEQNLSYGVYASLRSGGYDLTAHHHAFEDNAAGFASHYHESTVSLEKRIGESHYMSPALKEWKAKQAAYKPAPQSGRIHQLELRVAERLKAEREAREKVDYGFMRTYKDW